MTPALIARAGAPIIVVPDELIHAERRLLATGGADISRRHPGDGPPRRHVMEHDAARGYPHAIADGDVAENLGAGAHHHATADLGMAIAIFIAGAAKRDAMQHGAIVPNHRRLANDNAGG